MNGRKNGQLLLGLALLSILVMLGWLGWQLTESRRQGERLASQLQEVEQRLGDTRRQAEDARVRARQAELAASQAQGEAAAARVRAEFAERDSELARAERSAEEQARRDAERLASEAEQARRRLMIREADARLAAAEAYERATAAESEIEVARAETAKVREERARELDRLQGALSELAETRRTALGLVMNLGTGVEFDLDSARLRPENRELLARIAGVLLTAGDYHIQVFGHTDDIGEAEYNQQLSERRAQSVVDYLTASGIREGIISASGLGESQPLVEGSSAEARQRNRRVEIAVISYNEQFVVDDAEVEPPAKVESNGPS